MMTRRRIGTALTITLLTVGAPMALARTAGHDEKPGGGQAGIPADRASNLPRCPVTGEPVDFSVKIMTGDGPVYFCCPSCIKKYEENPAKYAEKVATQREALKQRKHVQVACPLTGKPFDKDVFTVHAGEKVYFCCSGCKEKFEKNPVKFQGQLENSYTYQTRCPVMGGEIDPSVYTDLPTGQRVYFCCPSCEKKLLADPEKYAENLAKQGIHIDVNALTAAKAEEKNDQGAAEHVDDHDAHDHSGHH